MKSFRLITRFDQFKSKLYEIAQQLAKRTDYEKVMAKTISIEF